MKTHEATEQAYKNGYKKGYEDGKADAVEWIPVTEGCRSKVFVSWFGWRTKRKVIPKWTQTAGVVLWSRVIIGLDGESASPIGSHCPNRRKENRYATCKSNSLA